MKTMESEVRVNEFTIYSSAIHCMTNCSRRKLQTTFIKTRATYDSVRDAGEL